MGLIIKKGIAETYKLERSDPTGETYVVIKPATVADVARRDDLMSRTTRTYKGNSNDVEIRNDYSFSQRQALEVFLVMADCNVQYQDLDEKGEPKGEPVALFKSTKTPTGDPMLAMSQAEFMQAWGKLTSEVAEEIYEKVLAKNPQWAPF